MRYQVIAVDFDGTIAEEDWPGIGKLIPKAKEIINRFAAQGGIVILNTCRVGVYLDAAKQFLKENGITVHYFNENSAEKLACWPDTRKIGADMYIDDRNPGGPNWDLVEKLLFGDEG
ncbi:hypothetical protein [Anaeroselena agilis]|uniref:Polynucleotide kinase n=1 Tax=Anaeroselena agilis TaxID=3063788 RepID=A0ABU3NVX8_9FIRM|nr:hypothetical protein [Selenomonadales bacterium 4137-cl]